ncbi:MAG TPA: M15 family metallopeptidase [Acidimicrobiales bacterium]|nr:M15 family metallopeptidase [Acidimicrobiales bacterium]
MEGRAIGAAIAVALLVAALGAWSALRWDGQNVVDAAADLSDVASAAEGGTTSVPAADAPQPPPPTTPTSVVVPDCVIGDEVSVGDPAEDYGTIVVDANRALPGDFEPPDLVSAAEAGFETDDMIRQIIVEDLGALRVAAEENGTPLGLVSAYRSYSYQQNLYDREVAEEGEVEAQKETARPGHSEHQLGTAFDLLEAGSQNLVPAFAETATGQWLAEHAHEHGFVISYPDMPTTRTCYSFEPWHLRYVGHDVAAQIHDSGLAPREWMLSRPETP